MDKFNVGDIVKLKKVKNAIFQYDEDTYGVILNTIAMPLEVEYVVKWFDNGAVGRFNEYLLVKAQ
jgi:hypothetical protein